MLGKRVEVTASRANGEVFPAEMAMTISQINGAPVMTFFVRDISSRKKAEEEQARYAAELERSNRDLEQFAYVASHDLQEPLRKIRTFGDRLEVKCKDLLDETARECVEPHAERRRADAGADRGPADALAGDHAGPATSCRSIWREIAQRGGRRPGGADRAGPGPGGSGQAADDPGRAAANPAVAAEPDRQRPEVPPPGRAAGGQDRGPLRQAREQRQARKSLADEQCRITVEDNGIGFDEQYAERIFGIFQRLHPRDVYEGTGIGLAICRRIVEYHGGEITAQSKPGKGSTFEVAAAGGPGEEEAERGRVMAKQRGPFTILMADDDADDCLLVQEALAGDRASRTSCGSSATGSSCWITCGSRASTRTAADRRGPT